MNGVQHYEPIFGESVLMVQQRFDVEKREFLLGRGIDVIEVVMPAQGMRELLDKVVVLVENDARGAYNVVRN